MADKIKLKDLKVIEKITFNKEQILSGERYKHRVDLLGVLLEDGKQYSFDEVDVLLDKFMKGKVK